MAPVLVSAVVFLTFFPCLFNEFTNYDDEQFVTNNPLVKQFSWENTYQIFTNPAIEFLCVPLTIFSFNLEYQIFGSNPLPYHATNLLLHILNSVLVFWIIHHLSQKKLFVAFLTSLLFGIHPIKVESVAWITERKDVLYGFFFLCAILSYLYYFKNKHKKFYFISLISFLLSGLSKPMALTLPFVLILIDVFLQKDRNFQCIKNKIPFFVIQTVLLLWVMSTITYSDLSHSTSFTDYFFTRIKQPHFFIGVLVFYIWKLVWPLNLSFLYQNTMDNHYWTLKSMFVPTLWGAVLIICTAYFMKKSSKVWFGIGFYLLTLVPVIYCLPLANRFMYIPSLGIFYILAEAFGLILFAKYQSLKFLRVILSACFILILIFFSAQSWGLCKEWKNSFTLWSRILEQFPSSAMAYYGRGTYLLNHGQAEKALDDFNRAEWFIKESGHKAQPDLYYNRGCLFRKRGDLKYALDDYDKAIQINPRHCGALNGKGVVYAMQNDFEKSLMELSKAIFICPNEGEYYSNRAVVYFHRHDFAKAKQDIDRAMALKYPVEADFVKELKRHYGHSAEAIV